MEPAGVGLSPERGRRRVRGAGPGRPARHAPAGRGPRALPRRDGRVARRRRGPGLARRTGGWVRANDDFRRDMLDELRRDGPLRSRELPDTCAVPWRSRGWNNNRNVAHDAGDDGAARRGGRGGHARTRQAVGPGVAGLSRRRRSCPPAEAHRIRDERRLRALGIARARGPVSPVEPNDVGEAGEPAVIEGVQGRSGGSTRRYLGASRSAGGRRCSRRSTGWSSTASGWPSCSSSTTSSRCTSRRRSGGGATGRCRSCTATGWSARSTPPPTASAGVLRVDAIHEDVPFTRAMTEEVTGELTDLAGLARGRPAAARLTAPAARLTDRSDAPACHPARGQ